MTFLNPLPIYTWLLLIIPLIIFIINQRKFRKIKFSSLNLLIETKSINIKKIKIFNILLLIIRTLFIMIILIIIMKPVSNDSKIISSNGKLINIILINDNFLNKNGKVNGFKKNDLINDIIKSITNQYPLSSKLKVISLNKGLLYNGFNNKNFNYTEVDSKVNSFLEYSSELKQDNKYLKYVHIISNNEKLFFDKFINTVNDIKPINTYFHYLPNTSNNQFINKVKLLNIQDKTFYSFEVDLFNMSSRKSNFLLSINQKKYNYSNKEISFHSIPLLSKEISVNKNENILDTIVINLDLKENTEIQFLLESKNNKSIDDLIDDINDDNSFSYVFNLPKVINTAVFYNDDKLKYNFEKILNSFNYSNTIIDSNLLKTQYVKTNYLDKYSNSYKKKDLIIFLGYSIFEKTSKDFINDFSANSNKQVVVLPSVSDFLKDSFNFYIDELNIISKINRNKGVSYHKAFEANKVKNNSIKDFKLFDYFYHKHSEYTILKDNLNEGIWSKYKLKNGSLDLLGFTINDNIFLKEQLLYFLPLLYKIIIKDRISFDKNNFYINEKLHFPNTINTKKILLNPKNDSIIFYDEYSPEIFSKDIKLRIINNNIDNIFSFNQSSVNINDTIKITDLNQKGMTIISYDKNNNFNYLNHNSINNKILRYLIYLLLSLFFIEIYLSNAKPPRNN